MGKSIEIFNNGSIYEIENGFPTKVIETDGKVQKLSDALQFTQAENFILASPDKTPPTIANRRGQQRMLNQEGLNLIKAFEGLYLEAYQDPVGVWTIGYGHIQDVSKGMKITPEGAENLLRQDLTRYEKAVEDAVEVTINDNQFAALTSFCFNLGAGALFKSTLLKLLNQEKITEAADEFPRWDKAGGQSLLGLSRRRRAERALFLSESWESCLFWKPNTTLAFEIGKPLIKGEEVKQLQIALANWGLDVNIDGIFGEKTAEVVKQFQEQNNLVVDGVVGANTKKKLGLT